MGVAAPSSDVNPDFSFDLGGDFGVVQSPWDMSGPTHNMLQLYPVRMCVLVIEILKVLQVLQAQQFLSLEAT